MGLRFSLKHANWLAHILQPSAGPVPNLENDFEAQETLRALLRAMKRNFYSTSHQQRELERALNEVQNMLGYPSERRNFLKPIREFFKDTPWIALLIPGGDWEFDSFFSSSDLLNSVVEIRPDDPGLILQLSEGLEDEAKLELDNVFPAFRVALANATRWPGVLVWVPSGDAAFFEVPASIERARDRLRWLFSHLATAYGQPDLSLLKQQYRKESQDASQDVLPLRMLHLSDVHLGSRDAERRLPRVKQLIQQLALELGDDAPLVPVITGDLMDTPEEKHLNAVRDFIEFLHNIGTDDPVVILGNHDVRKDGWLSADLQNAMRIQTDRVRWFDEARVGFACFNSVRSGRLARGCIDETEMMDVGLALDRDPEKAKNYILAGLLHHHPIPVARPDWYKQEWYERLLGRSFDKTDVLVGSEQFLPWLRNRRIGLVLHGHKHIPRVDMHDQITIVGCGSTVGKVPTTEPGTTYMSINVVTVDAARARLSCRLRAERIPGGGFSADLLHETVLTARTL